MWKSEKAHFLELQVQQAISQILYELGSPWLAYSTRYNQYLTILHGFLKYITYSFSNIGNWWATVVWPNA